MGIFQKGNWKMPNWSEILIELNSYVNAHDSIRRKYLKALHELTGRNVIIYYSGWLQKPDLQNQGYSGFSLDDSDKNGFMTVMNGLDKKLGLDLFLHTPGGSIAATESLVEYLRSLFGTNIRVIVPQIAMSAGTMIACSSIEILMGKHSSLGPIDPQYRGYPTHGIIEEFNRAVREILEDPRKIPIWQPIIAKYNPTIIGECEKAIDWANQMVKEWLVTGMFKDDPKAEEKAVVIVSELGNHALTLSHERHISMARAQAMGLNVRALEDDKALQDAVLSVHHACIHTLTATPATKIIENHNGIAFISQVQVQGIQFIPPILQQQVPIPQKENIQQVQQPEVPQINPENN